MIFSDNNSNNKIIIILQDSRNRNDIILKSRVSPKLECDTNNYIIIIYCTRRNIRRKMIEHHKNDSVQDIRGNRIL